MKKIANFILIVITIFFYSCNENDDHSFKTIPCNGQCNIIKGRILREDNVGIGNVEVTFYSLISGPRESYINLRASTMTDNNGNYSVEEYITDQEFNSATFYIKVNIQNIEDGLSTEYIKPSDLILVSESISTYTIPNLENRNPINIVDYKVPYKTSQSVNLNNFNPTTGYDYFAIGNLIKYGFESEGHEYLSKQSGNGYSYAVGQNTTVNLTSAFGVNELKILKFKNYILEETFETINIENPNQNVSLDYSY